MMAADDTPSQAPPGGSSTRFIRALARELDEATSGNLASARDQLALGTAEGDRSAVRMMAVWLISHPEAAAQIRARMREL